MHAPFFRARSSRSPLLVVAFALVTAELDADAHSHAVFTARAARHRSEHRDIVDPHERFRFALLRQVSGPTASVAGADSEQAEERGHELPE